MHVLFLTENFPPETNASATRVSERAQYWIKWGYQITIITSAPNFPHGKLFEGYQNRWRSVELEDGLRIVRVKTFIAPNKGAFYRILDFISFMISALLIGVFEKRADVVVATSPQFFAAVGGWLLSLFHRAPFVFELGDLWPASIVAVGAMRQSPIISLIEKLELFLYRRSAAVVALTNSFKENLILRNIAGSKIAVIKNGVDLPKYSPRARDRKLERDWGVEGKFTIGYVGTHGMAHNLNNVLDAASKLREIPKINFVFVGAGAERAQLAKEIDYRVLENVKLISNQPKHLMPSVWSVCDVALVHLRKSKVFEGVIPSKIFEAMAMGIPILLASPEGEASNIIVNERVGLHVIAEDPEALANSVKRLYFEKNLYERLATQCPIVAKKYSREFQSYHMIKALELVVNGRGNEVANIDFTESLRVE